MHVDHAANFLALAWSHVAEEISLHTSKFRSTLLLRMDDLSSCVVNLGIIEEEENTLQQSLLQYTHNDQQAYVSTSSEFGCPPGTLNDIPGDEDVESITTLTEYSDASSFISSTLSGPVPGRSPGRRGSEWTLETGHPL